LKKDSEQGGFSEKNNFADQSNALFQLTFQNKTLLFSLGNSWL